MLRLVSPAPEGQGTAPPKRRRGSRSPALLLTPDEARHVRAALKATARAYGGCDVLATVLGVSVKTVHNATNPRRGAVSGTFVIRLAAAAGMTVEAVLSGKLSEAGRCAECGSRVGDRPAKGGAS